MSAVTHALTPGGASPDDRAELDRARTLLARGDAAQARRVLSQLLAGGGLGGDEATEGWLLDALAAKQLGLAGAAQIALSRASRLAAAERIGRPWPADEPALRQLVARQAELIRSYGLLPVDGPAQPGALVDAVTERESVVLAYLPTLLTTGEIAAELYVSANTVKTQLKSIYRKLGVRSRRAAVDQARRLGLL